ncbi:MAG TPA: FtsX-like permease family protein [Candidatus Acidoferrales bacterium]
MKARDMLDLATRNLRESALRNSLTTLGIAVGIASLVAMLSLGVGLQALASNRLNSSGLFDTVVVYSRRDISSFDRAERRSNPDTSQARLLNKQARADMAKLDGVVEVYPEVRFQTEVRIGDKSNLTTVAGLPLSAQQNDAFIDMLGRYFASDEAQEAVLQLEFAERLNPNPQELIGQDVVLRYAERMPLNDGSSSGISIVRREKALKIVGIVENEPFGGMRSFARGRVFVPMGMAEELNAMQSSNLRSVLREMDESEATYQSLLVRVANPINVAAVQNAIKQMGFTTWSVLDATQRLRTFFIIFDLLLGIFGSLAIAVASLGIVNTLVMAILERRREIGIMKAIGASDGDVKKLFFAEAGAMGLAGGGLGVALGWAMGKVLNFATNVYLQRQQLPPEDVLLVPWWLAAAAIGFALLVSLVSGLYPAARAAKLDPVEALRYE